MESESGLRHCGRVQRPTQRRYSEAQKHPQREKPGRTPAPNCRERGGYLLCTTEVCSQTPRPDREKFKKKFHLRHLTRGPPLLPGLKCDWAFPTGCRTARELTHLISLGETRFRNSNAGGYGDPAVRLGNGSGAVVGARFRFDRGKALVAVERCSTVGKGGWKKRTGAATIRRGRNEQILTVRTGVNTKKLGCRG